ncbi:MAG: GtrA family protein [Actinomycetaceae bacterium]|nr:GtrA family protein [Actinomycetaceae bacterium]
MSEMQAQEESSTGVYKHRLKKQALWYLFVGGSSAVIEYVLFLCIFHLFDVSLLIANGVAVVTATVYNYILSSQVTFRGARHPVWSLISYLVLWVVNFFLSTYMISLMLLIGIPSWIAKGGMQVCVAVWNFFLYKFVVFR